MRFVSKIALAIAGTSLVGSSAHAQGFEGVIQLREIEVSAEAFMEQAGLDRQTVFGTTVAQLMAFGQTADTAAAFEVTDITFTIKGTLARLESPSGAIGGPGGYATIDVERGVFRIVLASNNAYVEWTLDDMARLRPGFKPPVLAIAPEARGRFVATQDRRTVAGFASTGYRIEVGDEVKLAWTSSDLRDAGESFRKIGTYARTMSFGAEEDPDEEAMARVVSAMLAETGFPMFMVTLDAEKFTINETLSVNRTAVDDSLFAAPEGFFRVPVEQMFQGGNR